MRGVSRHHEEVAASITRRIDAEYLMGAQSPITAMKAWNADATRLPARMHSEYLRRLYVATERDHVSPWKSVYQVLHLVRAPASFVLSSGGHNVGIVRS